MKKEYRARQFRKMGILFLSIIFFSVFAVANGWSELETLNESELTSKIAEFEKRLDQNPNDYEMLKALGIAYGIKARKKPKKLLKRSMRKKKHGNSSPIQNNKQTETYGSEEKARANYSSCVSEE